jgi:hypothetical protein
MVLRTLVAAGLLLALLAPAAALADNDKHDDGGSSTNLSFASGSTSVSVTPPGGSAMPAITCTSVSPEWAAPLSGSSWISTNADCTTGVAGGNFTYTLSFTVPSGATNLDLKGSVLADDSTSISLNGNAVAVGTTGFTTPASFETTSGFVTGTNTLTFTVNNASGASGLDFTANLTGTGLTGTGVMSGENHGQCVSMVAHQSSHGRGHGQAVSKAAHECNHGGDSDDDD